MKKKTISDLLKEKGASILSINENVDVGEAVAVMNVEKVGSLLVKDDSGSYTGIITERDLLTHLGTCSEDLCTYKVKEIMSKDLICASPDDTLDKASNVMIENRIRHLPIVSKKEVVGVISMKDIVNFIRSGLEEETKYLRDYITDEYPR
ncbi:MAG: CBS domain-containing protein [Deltaproteobacteria bacterium]|uniref:CBS domain-containing protein n=1 Tax=Candidatus Zymogenus saltonus TaxID=2844893 RepID=A0A9D8KHX0_9DELT|nr:CBS domain-containing protein [Candidatus Zymogenus saltonus]